MSQFPSIAIRSGLAALAIALGWCAGQHIFHRSEPLVETGRQQLPAAVAEKPPTTESAEKSVAPVPIARAKARIPLWDKDAVLREGEALAARWPESSEEAHRRALELAAQDPLAGLTLLQPLRARNFQGITTWEREIMLDWANRDQAAMFTGLEAQLSGEGVVPDHWLSIAASIVQTENREGLGEMLRWMENTERGGSSNMTLAATSKLLTHLTAESADAVSEFLLKRADEPVYRDALVQLANTYAHRSPENALNRIQSFKDDSLRHDALMAVVAAVTWDAPNTVIEWFNNGKLVSGSSATGSSDAEATKLRDEILTTYFTSLVSSHPDYVAQYSSAISDPSSRGYLQKMAELMARTEELSPGDFWQHPPSTATANGKPTQ
jgi:hypothetical protein